MMNPIIRHRADFCPHCKNQSIEVFDYFNNPIGYSKIIDAYESGLLTSPLLLKRRIYVMRCRSCGARFNIRYEGDIPIPDIYESHKENKEFLSEFFSLHRKEEKKDDRMAFFRKQRMGDEVL